MTLRRGWLVFDLDEQPPYLVRFRSSNAGFLVILLGLAVPLVPVWYADIAHHSAIALGVGATCLVALPFVYVETCELNKAAGHCLLRRTGVLRARTISFPLSEITRVNIQIRDRRRLSHWQSVCISAPSDENIWRRSYVNRVEVFAQRSTEWLRDC